MRSTQNNNNNDDDQIRKANLTAQQQQLQQQDEESNHQTKQPHQVPIQWEIKPRTLFRIHFTTQRQTHMNENKKYIDIGIYREQNSNIIKR